MTKSEKLFERAVKRIPGGVNSPVRAYGSIGEAPRFIDRADGCYIYDVDGNRYIDYIDSWGPMILGHNFPAIRESVLKACENGLSFGCATEIEVEMAEFICERIPHVDMIRMVNSGKCWLRCHDKRRAGQRRRAKGMHRGYHAGSLQ